MKILENYINENNLKFLSQVAALGQGGGHKSHKMSKESITISFVLTLSLPFLKFLCH